MNNSDQINDEIPFHVRHKKRKLILTTEVHERECVKDVQEYCKPHKSCTANPKPVFLGENV
jgi:hypothetical protein